MSVEKIGRQGYLGLAIESSPGAAAGSPSVFLPFTENKLEGKHEPFADISSRASRVKDTNSVVGKQFAEGDVTIYLDASNLGYLLKMVLGIEAINTVSASPPVYDHLMTPTVSGNIPTTATLWQNRGVDTEQIVNAVVDQLDLEVTDNGIATAKVKFMGKFPTTGVTAPTLTTTSGTIFTFKDLALGFGPTFQQAIAAAAIKVTKFTMVVKNNSKYLFKSGSAQPDNIQMGALEVSGQYVLYFENVTDRNNYYNLTKQSMVATFTGANLGVAGQPEQVQIVYKKIRLQNKTIETGLENFFAIACDYVAEWDAAQLGVIQATLQNGKSTVY